MSPHRGANPDASIFGRDAPGVAWRPDPETAASARLARFVRSTGEPTLGAVQARATTDPAWFWAAAADDLALAWSRPARTVLDTSRGPAWARWWLGGAFDWSRAAVEPRATSDPDGVAVTWEGEDGAVRDLGNRRARGRRGTGCPAAGRPRGRRRRSGRDPPAHAARDGRRGARRQPPWSDLHADLLRLRRTRHREPAGRLRRLAADHRRRVPPARRVGGPQVRRGRGGRGGTHGPARAGRAPGRRRPRPGLGSRPGRVVG